MHSWSPLSSPNHDKYSLTCIADTTLVNRCCPYSQTLLPLFCPPQIIQLQQLLLLSLGLCWDQNPHVSGNIFCFISLLFAMATMIHQCEPEDRPFHQGCTLPSIQNYFICWQCLASSLSWEASCHWLLLSWCISFRLCEIRYWSTASSNMSGATKWLIVVTSPVQHRSRSLDSLSSHLCFYSGFWPHIAN